MSEGRRLVNMVLDAALTAGCAASAVHSLCRGLLGGAGALSTVLWLLMGLVWLVCSAVWMAHIERFLSKKPGDPLNH